MAQTINFNNTTPAAPTNGVNVSWQNDSSNPPNISANLPSGQGGVPNIPNQINATGLTANYNAGTAATIFTPTVATTLRVTVTVATTVAATTGAATSTMPSITLGWTDQGGIARTLTMIATSTGNTTTYHATATAQIYTNASTAVTITAANYASNTAAQMTYYLVAVTEVI